MSDDVLEMTPDFWERFIDEEWLGRHREVALEPALQIVDPHHHIWERPRTHYPVTSLLDDLDAGHNVRATVYMESVAFYREEGPEQLRPVGETEHVTAIAERVAQMPAAPAVAAGIIGHADLTLGAAVREVLDAHIDAGRGRFRGVRANLSWDDKVRFGYLGLPPGTAASGNFRAGIAQLAPLGLVCDVMAFHTNLIEIADLVQAFPDTTFIINHLGAPLGRGIYAQRQDEVFATWQAGIRKLASAPNAIMKIGGLGGPFFAALLPLKLREQPLPPSSERLAELYRPWFDVVLDTFGAGRCMFESNFPADKYDCSYVVLWNAYKRLAAGCSATEKAALFSGTATRVYGLRY